MEYVQEERAAWRRTGAEDRCRLLRASERRRCRRDASHIEDPSARGAYKDLLVDVTYEKPQVSTFSLDAGNSAHRAADRRAFSAFVHVGLPTRTCAEDERQAGVGTSPCDASQQARQVSLRVAKLDALVQNIFVQRLQRYLNRKVTRSSSAVDQIDILAWPDGLGGCNDGEQRLKDLPCFSHAFGSPDKRTRRQV